jgi:hypothetical protein
MAICCLALLAISGQFVQGAVPEDGQAAAFTQETPFQAQMRAATEGTGLGLGNLAFNRVTGRQVVGQNADGSPIFADDPDFQNPFRTAPTLAGVQQSQDIDPTTGLPAFQSQISTTTPMPTSINTEGLTALQSDPEAFDQTLNRHCLTASLACYSQSLRSSVRRLNRTWLIVASRSHHRATTTL